MFLKTLVLLTLFISLIFAIETAPPSSTPEEIIKDEEENLLKKFFEKQFEKIVDRTKVMEKHLKKYSTKAAEEFSTVFEEFGLQTTAIEAMKKVADAFSGDEKEESFKEGIQTLKKEVTDKLENILKHLSIQEDDITHLEAVYDSPDKIPKQSILSKTAAFKKYMIGFKCGGSEYPLIVCEKGEELPFKKSIMIPRTPLEYFSAYSDDNGFNIVEYSPIELPKNALSYEISLAVDVENTFTHNIQRVLLDNTRFAKDLDEMASSKIPVIGFMGELSFIYIKDDETNEYKLLESWNGKLGKELFLTFDEKKPKFFENAIESFRTTCTSVIHNVIATMSMSPETIASGMRPTFGYTLTLDDKNQTLYNYKTFDGTEKSESPSTLMTTLLKEHLKEIKKEAGEKPKEIAFFIFDNYSTEEKERVQKGLEKSCESLKIKCTFIEDS
uniref:Uncharacterized protein n=1 Tax=Panagrolaimus sp. PS1159 TaxID=55785 RepID=A0AC35FWG5_9BILA